jgi:hypothetical protein
MNCANTKNSIDAVLHNARIRLSKKKSGNTWKATVIIKYVSFTLGDDVIHRISDPGLEHGKCPPCIAASTATRHHFTRLCVHDL